jgi:hypothetical protein
VRKVIERNQFWRVDWRGVESGRGERSGRWEEQERRSLNRMQEGLREVKGGEAGRRGWRAHGIGGVRECERCGGQTMAKALELLTPEATKLTLSAAGCSTETVLRT